MQLTPRQRLVLIGVLQDQRRLAEGLYGDSAGLSREAWGRHRLRAMQARDGLVPMALADWIGHAPTNSEHVLYHREYARLEDRGLLVRCNPFGGRRTTHLKLTPAGRRVAEDLLAEELGSEDEEVTDWATVELLPIELPPEAGHGEGDSQ